MSSGTTDEATYIQIVEVLEQLENVGNLATLQAVKDGQVTPLEVYANALKNGMKHQLTVNLDRPLIPTIEGWLSDHDVKDATRKSYEAHLSVFQNYTNTSDTVRQLVERLEGYRKSAAKKKTATTFARTKALLLAFTKATYGETSELYLKVKGVPTIKNTKKGDVAVALSVSDVVRLTTAMSSSKATEMVWTMCYGGFRIGEFLEENDVRWETTKDSLLIHKDNPGHGNKGYSRVVMLPFPLAKPLLGKRQFRRNIDDARAKADIHTTSHTFRKCFAHWMEMAGIHRARRMAYLGHQNQSVTDLYEKHDVKKYLEEDAKKFRDYITEQLNPNVVKKKAKKGKLAKMGERLGLNFIDLDDLAEE